MAKADLAIRVGNSGSEMSVAVTERSRVERPAQRRASRATSAMWQTAVVALVVSFGLLGGAFLGSSQPTEYQATYRFRLDEALQIDHWDVPQMAANFGATLNDPATREAAGGAPGAYTGTHSTLLDGSSLVDVWTETTTVEGTPDRLAALADAALLHMIEQERESVEASFGAQSEEMDQIESTLSDLSARAGVVGDIDLADELDGARRDLVAKEAQLEVVADDDSYGLTRTTGEIAELESYIARLEPVASQWREATERFNELDDTASDWRRRLTELAAAEQIVTSGAAADTVLIEQKSAREVVGRYAAIGGGLAAMACLSVALFRSLRP